MSVPPVGGQLVVTQTNGVCFMFYIQHGLTGDWLLSLGLLTLLSVLELCSMTKLPGLAAQHPP